MLSRNKSPRSGFTLTELAVVLGVIGIATLGLWRLMSGGNQQLRDQSAASQQQQLIGAVQNFLASPDGQGFMTNNLSCAGNCAANANFPLPLPSAANPAGTANCNADANLTAVISTAQQRTTWCNSLPVGYSAATTNSYGQTYTTRVLRDATAAALPPAAYSFMIIASNGPNPIPDTDGGRLAAAVGGDGGFIYANNVCDAQIAAPVTNQDACGAYGSWAVKITTYGFPAANTAGSIASRTYASSTSAGNNGPWLARNNSLNNAATFNTMTTDLFMGAAANAVQHPAGGNINVYFTPGGVPGTAANSGGSIGMQEGILVMGNLAGVAPVTAPVPSTLYMGDFTYPNTVGGNGGVLNVQGGTVNLNTPGPGGGAGTINLQGGTMTIGGGSVTGASTSRINLNSDAATTNPLINLVSNVGTVMVNSLLNVTNQNECNMTSPGVPATCPYAASFNTVNVSNLLNANALYAQTFIYTASDIRLKKDIQPLADSLSDMMRLKPVSFAFKLNSKESMGFIAQDMEKIYPKLVVPGSAGMKAVNYEGLIAPLVESVQELKKENDRLRAQLQEQALRQDRLERQLQNKSK